MATKTVNVSDCLGERPKSEISESRVEQYQEKIRKGEFIKNPNVMESSCGYYYLVSDGHHKLTAYAREGVSTVEVEIVDYNANISNHTGGFY